MLHHALPTGRYLLTMQRDSTLIVSEHHDVPRAAMDRAWAIRDELIGQGWSPMTGPG